jgi:hypothetical protein
MDNVFNWNTPPTVDQFRGVVSKWPGLWRGDVTICGTMMIWGGDPFLPEKEIIITRMNHGYIYSVVVIYTDVGEAPVTFRIDCLDADTASSWTSDIVTKITNT